MSTKTQQDSKRIRNRKRILSVTIRRMVDTSPDTSYLGEYSNRPETDYAIDRAHSEDCASINPRNEDGKDWLKRIEEHFKTNFVEQTDEEKACLEILFACYDSMDCDCNFSGHWDAREYRYFYGPVENYKGETRVDIRKYIRHDYDRMESLNAGRWCYLGIRAEAEIQTGSEDRPNVVQRISSGGLWGDESDSGSYIKYVENEELAGLRDELLALGFSRRAVSQAFKNVQEVDS